MTYPILRLNAKADYRIRNGHVWVYSNEIDNSYNPLKSLQPGDLALIQNATGKTLGLAYVNPNTLISARILSFDPNVNIDADFFMNRISAALEIRNRIYDKPFYRLVFGESDFLPGLVVDRFGDTLVVQIATAGMERYLDLIVATLDKLINPKTIIVKNDGKMREVEGLESFIKFYKGSEIEELTLTENDTKFIAPIQAGQKTGWFYDHRMMRARLRDYVIGKKVLDVFSYIGGWGVQAAKFGAQSVLCTDISDAALKYVQKNAAVNDLQNVQTRAGDAFEVLQALHASGEKFDVIILDPPAFIPRRKDHAKGSAAYQKANTLAMQLLAKDGILVSGSCSMHLPASELRAMIARSGVKLQRKVQILEQGHQAPDHPIHPAIAETEYLKCFIARVTD